MLGVLCKASEAGPRTQRRKQRQRSRAGAASLPTSTPQPFAHAQSTSEAAAACYRCALHTPRVRGGAVPVAPAGAMAKRRDKESWRYTPAPLLPRASASATLLPMLPAPQHYAGGVCYAPAAWAGACWAQQAGACLRLARSVSRALFAAPLRSLTAQRLRLWNYAAARLAGCERERAASGLPGMLLQRKSATHRPPSTG